MTTMRTVPADRTLTTAIQLQQAMFQRALTDMLEGYAADHPAYATATFDFPSMSWRMPEPEPEAPAPSVSA